MLTSAASGFRQTISQFRIQCAVLSLAAMAGGLPLSAFAALPAPPQKLIDTTYNAPTGRTINVNSGGDLQAALNSANLNDTIVLQAGATFTGAFTLPNKTSGSGWIYVRSSGYDQLPPPGTRVSPADAPKMARIAGGAGFGSLMSTAPLANHYRFVGIEFLPNAGQYVYSVVEIGNADTSTATLPNNITFDRCFIHGDAGAGARRGVAMNGASIAVVDSYVSGFKENGADSQAVWAYNTPGPLKIVNNYLEAASENVLLGGAQPKISEFIPTDVEIRGNHMFKPLSWVGSPYNLKNLLELKLGIRVLVANNIFENNPAGAQQGFSLLVTPRNEYNSFPQAVTKDIAIVSNVFINVGSGIDVAGIDDGDGVPGRTSQRTERVLVQNNVLQVTKLNNADGRIFMVTGGPVDLTIDHNTGFTTLAGATVAMIADNRPVKADRFTFTNNIVALGVYGWVGSGTASPNDALSQYFTNYTMTKNAFMGLAATGVNQSQFPAGNFFPTDANAVKFLNVAAGNYKLAADSPYKNAGTDGKDLGADLDAAVSLPSPPPANNSAVPQPPKNLTIVN